MNLPPWLLEWEIKDLCKGLVQSAAQIRYMKREYGLRVAGRKPDGSPLVMRADAEALGLAGKKPTGKRGPNREALVATFGTRA